MLQQKSKGFFVMLALLGLINSIWGSTLLLLINNKVTNTPLPFVDQYDWQIYTVLIVLSFVTSRYFQSYMIRLTYDLGNDLGLSIFDKLRFTNYEEYQKLGDEKVRTAVADVTTLQRFPQAFIESFNAVVMVAIGVIYLFYINLPGAALITGILGVLATLYYFRNMAVHQDMTTVRDLANIYQQNMNDFLRGFREIKMSRDRSDNIFEHISVNRGRAKDLTVKTLIRHMGNELMGSYVWYLMIGIILFMLPALLHAGQVVSSSFIVTLLYLMGPMSIIITEIREFTLMHIAVTRLEEFDKVVSASRTIELGHGNDPRADVGFQSIRFDNVTYEYYDEIRAETFRLLPLNLEIRKGETIFITGGNGSGKSTFIHLLTGLYMPKSGHIYFNDECITPQTYPWYRDQLVAIHTDHCLFTENYDDFELNRNNARLMELLNKMRLTDIVTFNEQKNVIKATLSKGQQKRLALIYALMEEKEIIILDEWAAEQDPVFRAFFYKVLVPEMKAMGKTVIAVTHDDAYFDYAERVLRFDYGRVQSDVRQPAMAV
ncbi:ATP-binding cassette domain-containing protein [Chitinophaga sancti]|uniref:ATP-binding cassette domain-containing protein n=2 Tax=Chitinophaga sancti TaxID=1004 RepID=A0ABZ0XHB4_9BACT|nr:ATP-binding cassette domain-containing protein [Chitinophaga sancti]WQD64525.1 ATP-binding cassette domain-containing protein [Chitinophaga sancti]WQG89850.1 ATP-binding cassette domain-containing protein [Chitinophaga sancti]